MDRKSELETWNSFRRDVLRSRLYWLCLAFITALGYLFDLTNRSMGIDDMARVHYFGDDHALLAGTRWGVALWIRLLSSTEYAPFADKFLSILFLVISAVLFSRILYIYCGGRKYSTLVCTLFSCLFVSYPLIVEIWNYNGIIPALTGNVMLGAAAILLLYDERKIFSRRTVLCGILLSIVVSGYEASAFLYVTAVFSVLLMDRVMGIEKKWVIKGLRYLIPLAAGVVLRYAVGFGIIRLLGLEYVHNGQTGIMWNFKKDLITQFLPVVRQSLDFYFARALIFLPITVFVSGALAGLITVSVITVKRKDPAILLISLLLFISVFFQSVLQRQMMPYRTAQTLQYFSAFSLSMVIFALSVQNRRFLFPAALVIVSYLAYRQGIFLNQALALNNQRSDNEAAVVHNIGYRLKSMYDDKPVIFVGNHDLGGNINRQTRPDPSTPGGYLYRKIAIHFGWDYDKTRIYDRGVTSVLSWAETAFGDPRMMKEIFSYYGYDITVPEVLSWRSYSDYVQISLDEGMKPLEIRDMGDYLLVLL